MWRNSGYTYRHLMTALLVASLHVGTVWAEWTVPTLMQALASQPHPAVPFRESKTLAYLNVALTSNGVLSIDQNGRLIKETTSPHYERLIVDRQTVRSLRDGEDEVRLLLSDFPVISGFVEAFRATLQGDLATLSRYYLLELSGSGSSWSLQLRPQQATLAAVIRVIEVTGEAGRVVTISVQEQSGDLTTLTMLEP